MLPVWFLIGVLPTLYGVILLIPSIDEWSHPSAAVLAQHHPGIWGGTLLLLFGVFCVPRFRPRRPRGKQAAAT
ncbi:MAG: hypothetical protein WBE72_12125 [Terracidiphilus sp.]